MKTNAALLTISTLSLFSSFLHLTTARISPLIDNNIVQKMNGNSMNNNPTLSDPAQRPAQRPAHPAPASLPPLTLNFEPSINGQSSFSLYLQEPRPEDFAPNAVLSDARVAGLSFGDVPQRIERAWFEGGPDDAQALGCMFVTVPPAPGQNGALDMDVLGNLKDLRDGLEEVFYRGEEEGSEGATGVLCLAYYMGTGQ